MPGRKVLVWDFLTGCLNRPLLLAGKSPEGEASVNPKENPVVGFFFPFKLITGVPAAFSSPKSLPPDYHLFAQSTNPPLSKSPYGKELPLVTPYSIQFQSLPAPPILERLPFSSPGSRSPNHLRENSQPWPPSLASRGGAGVGVWVGRWRGSPGSPSRPPAPPRAPPEVCRGRGARVGGTGRVGEG